FVAWDILDQDLIGLALECIPPLHLKKWFERILLDIKSNRSGFPDLIQFWPAEKRYDMIEVKGPGDRLQDNQKRWIDYCARHGMPVSVCYLQWNGFSSAH
ncbi:MAG TPA: VRR-NUC domain-containing protein, partial [Janthinobacterium sp.]|nr:VRR-NUC domain-containing protein [Janthinobacterium sp.]